MSVTAQNPYKKFTAAPGATLFSTGFRLILASDLVVKVNGVVRNTGFTVSSLGAGAGSDVTFGAPMTGGELVELIRAVPRARATDYQQLGDYQSSAVNNDFDRLVMMVQEVAEQIARSLTVPAALTGFNGEIPAPVGNYILGIKPDGSGFQYYGPTDNTLVAAALAAPTGSTIVSDKAAGLSNLAGTVRESLGKAEGVSRLFQALNAGRNDVHVLLQSDSTGDEAIEFFALIAQQIADLFPAYTANYYRWNDPGSNYPAPTTLRAGTGSKFIRFYNAAKPGVTPDYYNGARRVAIYDGWKFDLVISNLGLNVGESFDAHIMKMTQYLAQLANDQPQADVLITLQPPDYTNSAMLDRSANRVNAQRWIAGQFGCGVIDVYTRFKTLVDAAGGVDTAYYLDHIHPTALGGIEWAKVALYEVATARQLSSIIAPLGRIGPTPMPNGNMDSWLKGTSAAPTFWKTANCTALKDSATKETGSASARVTGSISSTGLFYVSADDLIYKFGKGNSIVVAARVWTEGGAVKSGNAGKVFCAHSVSTTYTEISSPTVTSVEGDGAWRWVYLIIPPSFYQGRSDFWLGVYSGNSGEFTRVDRVLIGSSIHLLDSDSSCSYTKKITTSDTSHTVTAGATTQRIFSGMNGAVKGCSVQVESPDVPAGIYLRTVSETDNQITLYVTNLTGSSIVVPAMGLMFTVA